MIAVGTVTIEPSDECEPPGSREVVLADAEPSTERAAPAANVYSADRRIRQRRMERVTWEAPGRSLMATSWLRLRSARSSYPSERRFRNLDEPVGVGIVDVLERAAGLGSVLVVALGVEREVGGAGLVGCDAVVLGEALELRL